MSQTANDGGPAFPTVPLNNGYPPETYGAGTGCGSGLSLRDYFAAKAMNGLISSPAFHGGLYQQQPEAAAEFAWAVADAMLAAREQGASL